MCEKEDMQTARLWADRAEEFRAIAAGMSDRGCRDTMMSVANNWDRMAAQKLRPIRGMRVA